MHQYKNSEYDAAISDLESMAVKQTGTLRLEFRSGFIEIETDGTMWADIATDAELLMIVDRLACAAEDPAILVSNVNTDDLGRESAERLNMRAAKICRPIARLEDLQGT